MRNTPFTMRSVTILKTKRLVVQDTPPDENGMVTIRYQSDGHTEQIHESKVARIRKNMRGLTVDVYYCGKYTEGTDKPHTTYATPKDKKVTWTCWCPIHNAMSAWVRLEAPGYRTRFVYDPGSHWRKTLSKQIN